MNRTTLRDRNGRKMWHWCHAYAVFSESASGQEIGPREMGELYVTVKPTGPGEMHMDMVFVPDSGNGRLERTADKKMAFPPVCRIHDAEDDELMCLIGFGRPVESGDLLTVDFGHDLNRVLP